ncbi:Dol-P-Man:Man(5)GlcNAc(2)-PP-Dol alpha-1,3-mannosyltransferase OS=Phaeosphaeria nodorum (strain SN15 / ATCC MYA-4574 / FGSC 10173) GN=ALG3 PE=3 SV=2 [Rhizoctonia solani AG-1 IB]|uniref:Dol-P-Man:Man(5)GlcNAc(2)-PP-Dol alpha-1,3-mannosyltransferase n=1 Tax=Thanatephorus cucumeris (strain AG1-IB / isolate 7/3/14) TaxID=1108050 RepID=A0A0B7FNN4_THACB|nr:Dol-P-Man:Man(5)GlcNAc(2)-PP-Dol alpha-1,3-mannosyltransferase OS=Phaeosphaeria nodorum (strain SN15 / ATCC MYA-4574 / FGSC 10173) GN=ALG3 PE=3 SV=2 [Rhizoctonia solani AG-1 IB]
MSSLRLSQGLRHLLTLRGASAVPAPSAPILDQAFTTTRDSAKTPGLADAWLAVTTGTLLTVNSPDSIGYLYKFVTRDSSYRLKEVKERVAAAALMREAGIKCGVFVGVPKTINGLAGLYQALEDDVKAALPKENPRNQANTTTIQENGLKLFKSVYDPHTEKLLAKLQSYHPDFAGWIVEHEYGALLSNVPGHNHLSRTLTSAVAVASLRASGGVGPQLVSHVYGLLKARGFDPKSETEDDRWLASEQGAEWVIALADAISDVVVGTHVERAKL